MNKFKLLPVLLALAGTSHAMQNDDLGMLLWVAARDGKHEVVASLLDCGVAVNWATGRGLSPLAFAAKKGHQPVVQLLLDRGATVNYADCDGWSSLMLAAREGHQPVVQLLLDRGAALNQKSWGGKTALMWAAERDQQQCCEIIVEHLIKIPNDLQRKKIYQILMHMKRSGCINRDIRNLFKPFFLQVIEQENRERPEESVAYREISRIGNLEIKEKLISKYWPHNTPSQKCVIQ